MRQTLHCSEARGDGEVRPEQSAPGRASPSARDGLARSKAKVSLFAPVRSLKFILKSSSPKSRLAKTEAFALETVAMRHIRLAVAVSKQVESKQGAETAAGAHFAFLCFSVLFN